MNPKVSEIWSDGGGGCNSAGLEITCCNETHRVTITDFNDIWTCPECSVTLKFSFRGVSWKIVNEGK